MRSETIKRGDRTNQINSGWKLIGLHRKFQSSNCASHQCKMCLQRCGINSKGKVSIGLHQNFLLENQSVVVQRTVDLRLFVSVRLEETDNFRDGGHGDDAGSYGVRAGAGAQESGSCGAVE